MFDLLISNFADLDIIIPHRQPTHVISAINHIEPLPCCQHLHVNMSDIVLPMEGHTRPTMAHLKQVLAFTRDLTDDDRLLVHCQAGQSRSTALAIAILIQHGMAPRAAFDYVEQLRPILSPNQLIIQFTDEYFDLQGELIKIVHDFRIGELANRLRPTGAPTQADVDWFKQMMQTLA